MTVLNLVLNHSALLIVFDNQGLKCPVPRPYERRNEQALETVGTFLFKPEAWHKRAFDSCKVSAGSNFLPAFYLYRQNHTPSHPPAFRRQQLVSHPQSTIQCLRFWPLSGLRLPISWAMEILQSAVWEVGECLHRPHVCDRCDRSCPRSIQTLRYWPGHCCTVVPSIVAASVFPLPPQVCQVVRGLTDGSPYQVCTWKTVNTYILIMIVHSCPISIPPPWFMRVGLVELSD